MKVRCFDSAAHPSSPCRSTAAVGYYGQDEASILTESTFSFGAGAAAPVAPAEALGLVDLLALSTVPVTST